MNSKDEFLRNRLGALQDSPTRIPTDDELHERLRKLKDTPDGSVLKRKYVVYSNTKTNVEQVDELLQKYTHENEIVNRQNSSAITIDKLEQRLQKLKSDNESVTKPPNISEQKQSYESDTKKLLKKILKEAELENKMESMCSGFTSKTATSSTKVTKMNEDEEEEEFCTICVRRPQWICLDCDNHAFCARCFEEFHEELVEKHRKKTTSHPKSDILDSDEYSD